MRAALHRQEGDSLNFAIVVDSKIKHESCNFACCHVLSHCKCRSYEIWKLTVTHYR